MYVGMRPVGAARDGTEYEQRHDGGSYEGSRGAAQPKSLKSKPI